MHGEGYCVGRVEFGTFICRKHSGKRREIYQTKLNSYHRSFVKFIPTYLYKCFSCNILID